MRSPDQMRRGLKTHLLRVGEGEAPSRNLGTCPVLPSGALDAMFHASLPFLIVDDPLFLSFDARDFDARVCMEGVIFVSVVPFVLWQWQLAGVVCSA